MLGNPSTKAPKDKHNTLHFHQVNVGRGGENTDIALQQAWDAGAHVVMVQEPWTRKKEGGFITKSHPGYNSHIPFGGTDVRPRVSTFTRKGIGATQFFPPSSGPTSDYCFVKMGSLTFVNVYRAPGTSGTLEPLLRWVVRGLVVVGGDFNSVSQHWQPQTTIQYGNGGQIMEWATAHDMDLVSIVGEPTHRDGNVLDLTWSNTAATASVSKQYHCTSDHSTIEGTVLNPTVSDLSGIVRNTRVSDENLKEFNRCVSQWTKAAPLDSVMDIEKFTANLLQALADALKIAGKVPAIESGKTGPWWNDECRIKWQDYKAARENPDLVRQARKSFRAVVRKAKREYWKRQVEAVTTDAQVFKLMRWAKPRPAAEPPPLQIEENRWLSDPRERASALRDILLARFSSENDIPTWENGQEVRIPWDTEISLEDVTNATISVNDTAPGADKITVRLLKSCWYHLGPLVKDLYQACLKIGHFPTAFRVADVVLLPKPGRNLSTAKGWRPISLLSSLGKGLERLVGKRMAWLTISHQVVHPQLFGSVPGRSAVDLASCVIHDAEAAMRSGKCAAMVTLDIQGAFDAVLHNRLLQRLREQGWPLSLCRFIQTFLCQRKVQVKYRGGTTDEKMLECGVPQGSPLSPLLFMLYIAVLFKDHGLTSRFGYADDLAIIRVGSTAAEAIAAVQEDLDSLVLLAREHRIEFDPAKSELLVTGGGPRKKINTANLSILVKDRRIEPSPHIRWLGVWLDTQLNFKQHVQEWTGKANRLVHFLRHINGVQRGAAPGPLIRAVQACVLSTALYGAEAWWPGLSRITTIRDKEVGTGVGWHTSLLDKTITKAIRVALPAWRTTPNSALHREAGIPPASIILQQKMLRSAARMRRMDAWHPLALRAAEDPKDTIKRLGLRSGQRDRLFRQPERYMTRLQISVRQVPTAEGPGKLYFPHGLPASTPGSREKEARSGSIKRWLTSLPANAVCAFSDGSSSGPGQSAWGYVVYQGGKLAGSGSGPLPGAEVFDAEVVGAMKALEAALAVGEGFPVSILLDNQAAVRALEQGRSNSSQTVVDKFSSLRHNRRVEIHWIPGHVGIQGNEEADKLAKSALGDLNDQSLTSASPNGDEQILTFAALGRLVKMRSQKLVEEWWQKYRPKRYKDLDLYMRCKRPPELALPRWAYHRLIAARTGHGDYADYHRRFNPEHEDLMCICGREKRPWHFSECRPALQRWRSCEKMTPPGVREMIGEKGWQKFFQFLTISRCYSLPKN